jgi:hypothetical protein
LCHSLFIASAEPTAIFSPSQNNSENNSDKPAPR